MSSTFCNLPVLSCLNCTMQDPFPSQYTYAYSMFYIPLKLVIKLILIHLSETPSAISNSNSEVIGICPSTYIKKDTAYLLFLPRTQRKGDPFPHSLEISLLIRIASGCLPHPHSSRLRPHGYCKKLTLSLTETRPQVK